jgi:hypothetical protein
MHKTITFHHWLQKRPTFARDLHIVDTIEKHVRSVFKRYPHREIETLGNITPTLALFPNIMVNMAIKIHLFSHYTLVNVEQSSVCRQPI